jgi:hypothetical protein
MRRHSSRPVREDPEWAIATSVEIREHDGAAAGRITARRHPTGWFITASHPAGMSGEERSDFAHFVCVRVYLLLRQGAVPGLWERGPGPGEWIADLVEAPLPVRLDVPGRFRPRA